VWTCPVVVGILPGITLDRLEDHRSRSASRSSEERLDLDPALGLAQGCRARVGREMAGRRPALAAEGTGVAAADESVAGGASCWDARREAERLTVVDERR